MRIVALICFVVCCSSLQAQEGFFGKSLYLGTSLTYIPDYNRDFKPVKRYDEWTWNADATVRLNSFLYGGLRFKRIFTNGTRGLVPRPSENYYMVGLLGQFDLLEVLDKQKLTGRNRLLVELSWDYGNYCVCERDDPHKVEGLQYMGWGVSYDLAITPVISLDLGFNANYILNYSNESYSYTQYIIGLNFLISKNR